MIQTLEASRIVRPIEVEMACGCTLRANVVVGEAVPLERFANRVGAMMGTSDHPRSHMDACAEAAADLAGAFTAHVSTPGAVQVFSPQ